MRLIEANSGKLLKYNLMTAKTNTMTVPGAVKYIKNTTGILGRNNANPWIFKDLSVSDVTTNALKKVVPPELLSLSPESDAQACTSVSSWKSVRELI